MFHPLLSAHDETPHNDQQAHFVPAQRAFGSPDHQLARSFAGGDGTATFPADFENAIGSRVIAAMTGNEVELGHAFLI